mmetsp:Transcript_2160/g.6270  ORF Transcript_2160/g.6270 Transcript_2160/m.6270 type:complete len:577 (+) Transcript_2160:501-2231(+)|eukprot:CAMPEP_0181057530 /NCGR_PEP_ID=MMETSP1070-20121207/20299_1 /TAXON_ID=265543 /ORGANISM="Minutocellus polymorphus, Strain NH13" /LENGTH=576 /DNA_ID=CAMNT_0023136949 /DNA_START=394 /DNA_END=2124 /DNA_ORIENTATION=+
MKRTRFLLTFAVALVAIDGSIASSPAVQEVSPFNTRGRRKLQRCREKDDDEFRTAARGNQRPCSWLKNDKDHIKDECGNRRSEADEVCPVTCGACKDDGNDDDDDEDKEPDSLGNNFDELEYLGDGFKGHGRCSGNCKKDGDCKGNLECFERDDDEDIPGCGDGKGGKDSVNYCYDPDDVIVVQPQPTPAEIAPKSSSPTKAPTSKRPTDKRTDVPSRKPTAPPTREPSKSIVEEADSTSSPTQAPVAKEEVEEEDESGLGNSSESSAGTPKGDFVEDDIGISIPPFVVAISFLTPSRRQLGILADNINTNKLESAVADVIGQKMLAAYPNTFQDVDIEADLIAETEQKGTTTVSYECSGQAIFLDAFSVADGKSRLPHSKDLELIVLEALDDDMLSEKLRSSNDAVLSASQNTYVATPGTLSITSADDSNNGVSVGMVVLVAVIVGCALLLIGVALVIHRLKSDEKVSSGRTIEEGGHIFSSADDEFADKSSSKGDLGIMPSPTRTHNTSLEDSYEHDSNAGDYSVGYSESILESVMDGGSIGRCDGEFVEDYATHTAAGDLGRSQHSRRYSSSS